MFSFGDNLDLKRRSNNVYWEKYFNSCSKDFFSNFEFKAVRNYEAKKRHSGNPASRKIVKSLFFVQVIKCFDPDYLILKL